MVAAAIVLTIAGGALVLKLITDAERAAVEQRGDTVVIPLPWGNPEDPTPTPTPAPPSGGVPDPSTVGAKYARAPGFVQAVIREHFDRDQWDNAAGVAECESSFVPTAHNTNGEDSRGLWQINIGPGANTDMASWDLFDPFVNGRAAAIILKRQGWRAWFHCARRNGLI